MTIRTASAADFAGVVALWASSAGPTKSPGAIEDVDRLVRRDPDALLIAEVGGEIVGTLVVGWDGWRCHVYRLAIKKELRRHSIASSLLDSACERVRALGARRMDAMVDRSNTGGVAFWTSAGFVLDCDDDRWALAL